MILPGFFLEYLVTGSCALLWIYGLFAIFGLQDIFRINSALALLIAPAIYVVGLVVDAVSRTVLRKGRMRLEKRGWIKKDSGEKGPLHYSEILLESSDLAKQIELRSSRDRIARGAVGNILAATIVFTVLAARVSRGVPWYAVLLAGIILLPATIVMWDRLEYRTSSFTRKAANAVLKSSKTTKRN